MHQVIQDMLYELKSQGLGVHFPEHVPIAGTVPPCEEAEFPWTLTVTTCHAIILSQWSL